jgi:DnaJ-class molecular chaperone
MIGSTTNASAKPCPACGGLGFQFNRVTGINERCPVCGGGGLEPSSELIITC